MPDDISELEADVAQLRIERTPAPAVGRLRRALQTRRWHRYGLSGPLVVVTLLVVLFFASLVFLLLPSPPQSPRVRPLAGPRVPAGQAGGLLPDLALPVGNTGAIRLRNLRPAVIVLLPVGCRCGALVSDVISSTSASRLPVLLVGESADPPLPRNPPARTRAATDGGGRLGAAYGLAGTPVAIFVRSDGTVSRVLPDAVPGAAVHDEVAGLAG